MSRAESRAASEGIRGAGPASRATPGHASARPGAVAPTGRIIGRYGAGTDGPIVLCVGGLHGNEPSGIRALRRVTARLEDDRPAFHGEIVAIAGNLPALAAGRRFIDRDLNRGWGVREVAAALEDPVTSEDSEKAALLEVLVPAIRCANDAVYLLDLHTTSSTSPPFITLSDTLEARALARRLGMPIVLGIEEEVDTMADYLSGFGAAALGIESGRHDDPTSVEVHEAALWLALETVGCLPPHAGFVDPAACRARVAQARRGLPDVFEVVYRKAIAPGDRFRMAPGFDNFDPVDAGDPVAEDAAGPVFTPVRGRLFLPLYQSQGADGFFVVRPVRPFWLAVSRMLRRLGAPALLPLLPGVRASAVREDTLVVSRRVARWFVPQIFHLMGYRRVRETGRHVVFRGRGTRAQSSSTSAAASDER